MPADIKFPDYVDPVLQDDFIRDGYIYDIYDGDTVYYHVNLGYNSWDAFQTGRLLDVWAPEIRPLRSRADATASRDYLWDLVKTHALNRHKPEEVARVGHHVRVRSLLGDNKWFRGIPQQKKGKYGRWLVCLLGADDNGAVFNINEEMVRSGHATATA